MSDAQKPERTRPRFAPKEPIELDPPQSTPISREFLAQCNGAEGSQQGNRLLIAIRGKVFDVTRNQDAYGPGKGYNIFCGSEASRALALTSLERKDVEGDLEGKLDDLTPEQIQTLVDWETFFGYRYNVVGLLEGSAFL
ncbi:cytochrome b5-like heme/steroid binding domain-containing protein [Protomyces lactucae-debilis]|uniref:Cytochrome b5-like heme/steroid binding domain-containing protein n=1 Tax=Protomyces lactucae-debilis TaxID=2754530 RepID=A0A1Y2F6L8_PROLT|nr:cytochrome b5-like heme/steroid binding domain-containing protein [Protomyces lactucae-debilis]ORY78575.1 cytochrome b5-like heme/steroid binding domain-containing protein [Protomyces lactucae-debilis]